MFYFTCDRSLKPKPTLPGPWSQLRSLGECCVFVDQRELSFMQ